MLDTRDIARVRAREMAAREFLVVERFQLALFHQLGRQLALFGGRAVAPADRLRLGELPHGFDPLRYVLAEPLERGDQMRSRGHAENSSLFRVFGEKNGLQL